MKTKTFQLSDGSFCFFCLQSGNASTLLMRKFFVDESGVHGEADLTVTGYSHGSDSYSPLAVRSIGNDKFIIPQRTFTDISFWMISYNKTNGTVSASQIGEPINQNDYEIISEKGAFYQIFDFVKINDKKFVLLMNISGAFTGTNTLSNRLCMLGVCFNASYTGFETGALLHTFSLSSVSNYDIGYSLFKYDENTLALVKQSMKIQINLYSLDESLNITQIASWSGSEDDDSLADCIYAGSGMFLFVGYSYGWLERCYATKESFYQYPVIKISGVSGKNRFDLSFAVNGEDVFLFLNKSISTSASTYKLYNHEYRLGVAKFKVSHIENLSAENVEFQTVYGLGSTNNITTALASLVVFDFLISNGFAIVTATTAITSEYSFASTAVKIGVVKFINGDFASFDNTVSFTKYSSIVNGVAKQSGAQGDVIEVYIPKT